MEYRKSIPLDAKTKYWLVELGELNFLNGGSSYHFCSEDSAWKFARNHKLIAKQNYGVDRKISVHYPDGTTKEVN